MKTGLSVRKIGFCLIGFQLLYMGMVQLLERFFHGSVLLIWYVGLLVVLYYYHFAELKLWQKLFYLLKFPYFQKQLFSLRQRLVQSSEQLKDHTFLYISFALLFLTLAVSFILLASVSILLIEVYWLTDFSLGNSFCPFLWLWIAIFTKLVFVGIGWVTSTKDAQNEGQMP